MGLQHLTTSKIIRETETGKQIKKPVLNTLIQNGLIKQLKIKIWFLVATNLP